MPQMKKNLAQPEDAGTFDKGQVEPVTVGGVGLIPPGHDAWVVGNEPVVMVDIQGIINYAKY
jgi:hypothetical protein